MEPRACLAILMAGPTFHRKHLKLVVGQHCQGIQCAIIENSKKYDCGELSGGLQRVISMLYFLEPVNVPLFEKGVFEEIILDHLGGP